MKITNETPLGQAIEWLMEVVDEGVECPCCGQFAKIYKRKLTASIATVLIKMHQHSSEDWVYMPDIRSRGQDESIARFWGLIEQRPGEREDGSRRVGWWRLTSRGRDFICGRIKIPKYAMIFNGELIGLDSKNEVSISDVLGKKFSYNELMSGI